MKKNIIASAILALIVLMAIGCNKESDKKEVRKSKITADYYGDELYNASFISIEDNEVSHNIPIMSKKKLEDYNGSSVSFSYGEAIVLVQIEKGDYKLDGYNLYYVQLSIEDIKYEEDKFGISKIRLDISDDDFIEIKPDKFEIRDVSYLERGTDIQFTNVPLDLPMDMNYIPLDIQSEKNNITLSNVYLTNTDMKISYNDGSNKFEKFTFFEKEVKRKIKINFETDDSDISKYKQYATSIIVEYEAGEKKYYNVTGGTTFYNKLIESNNIEKYYYR